MNNFVKTALILSVTFFAANADAGVRFLVDSPTHTQRDILKGDGGIKIKRMCNNRGYTKTHCNRNEVALEFCPQNSSYFRYCCPEGFSSTKEECYEAGMEPSSRSCHGYYRCEIPETPEKEDLEYNYDESYYEEDMPEETLGRIQNDESYDNDDITEEHLERRQQVHPIVRTKQLR